MYQLPEVRHGCPHWAQSEAVMQAVETQRTQELHQYDSLVMTVSVPDSPHGVMESPLLV